MALRNIVVEGDEILTKKCREVVKFDDRLAELLDDMIGTMREAEGVGIAAPQVGILRQVCVIEPEPGYVTELINPIILEQEGEQEGYEGCLSVPGYIGCVKRPMKIKVRAQTRTGGQETYVFEGFDAVAACHEMDHLKGILYTSKATDVHKPAPVEEDGEEVVAE